MVSITSPTVRQRRLAHELRRLREERRLSCEQVGRQLEWSAAKVSRIETGRVKVHPSDVSRLLDLYGLRDPQGRDRLVTMSREARQKGWWEPYRHDVSKYIEHYVGLEAEATEILTYQIALVPALLQTAEYARALAEALPDALSPREADDVVALRLKRQEAILGRAPIPRFVPLIDEGILWRQYGDRDVTTRQLKELLAHTELRDVYIVPFSGSPHPQPQISFTILRFGEDGDDDLVFIEQLANSVILESPSEVDVYRRTFDRLRGAALDREASASLIKSVLARIQAS